MRTSLGADVDFKQKRTTTARFTGLPEEKLLYDLSEITDEVCHLVIFDDLRATLPSKMFLISNKFFWMNELCFRKETFFYGRFYCYARGHVSCLTNESYCPGELST